MSLPRVATCPRCGKQVDADDPDCPRCGWPGYDANDEDNQDETGRQPDYYPPGGMGPW